jgi:hypothetical protein
MKRTFAAASRTLDLEPRTGEHAEEEYLSP